MTLLLLLSTIFTNTSPFDQANPLRDFRWKNRIVLVFSPNDQNENSRQWEELISFPEDLVDRDIILIRVYENRSISLPKVRLTLDPETLRSYYHNKGENELLLIGKDGGVKLRTLDFIKSQEIFDLIDSMPMRISEMKKKDS